LSAFVAGAVPELSLGSLLLLQHFSDDLFDGPGTPAAAFGDATPWRGYWPPTVQEFTAVGGGQAFKADCDNPWARSTLV
jgi:hypothetical protein